MWKVLVLSVIVFALVPTKSALKSSSSGDVIESKLYCNRLCSSFGAKAYFNKKCLTCKCDFVETIDDADIALIKKNAKLLNLNIEITQSMITHSNTRKKRRIPRYDDSILGQKPQFLPLNRALIGPLKPPLVQPPKMPLLVPPKPSLFPQNPPLLPPNRPLLPPNPSLLPRNSLIPPVFPISQSDALRALTDVRQRVRNLARNNQAAKNAQAHITAIRASLSDLSKRIVVPNPHLPAVDRARMAQARRARLNNFRIQAGGGLLPLKPGLVGSVASDTATTLSPGDVQDNENNSDEETVQSDVDSTEQEVIIPKRFHKAIITQPKELFDS